MQIYPSEISNVIEIKAGDTMRIAAQQLQLNGENINLVSMSAYLIMHDPETGETTTHTGSITSAVSGSVQYTFQPEDIATAGTRLAEWKLVDQNNKVIYIPDDFIYIDIKRNLE